MENILTIDVEEWYDVTSLSDHIKNKREYKSLVVKQTVNILNILSKYKTKATFFMLGYIVESFPDLAKEIVKQGHEVGIHGFSHRLLGVLSITELKEEINRSRAVLGAIAGFKNVVGYRAPSWSITDDSRWVLNFLEQEGFLYDSSLFPCRFRYGGDGLSRVPHIPEGIKNLWEIPPSVFTPFNIPFSGGFFLRFLPYNLINLAMRRLNEKKIPAVVYIHPWEMDINHPRIKASFKDRYVHYYNIETAERKLMALLSDFRFITIREWLTNSKFKNAI